MLTLLDAPEELTRLHALRVVEGAVMRQHGWRPGLGFADPSVEASATAQIRSWAYDYSAPRPARLEAQARITASLGSQAQ